MAIINDAGTSRLGRPSKAPSPLATSMTDLLLHSFANPMPMEVFLMQRCTLGRNGA